MKPERCAGQHDDCPWCDAIAEAKASPFEVRFDDGQQTVHTVEQAQTMADAVFANTLGAAETVLIVRES
jgi:hypothetical protein